MLIPKNNGTDSIITGCSDSYVVKCFSSSTQHLVRDLKIEKIINHLNVFKVARVTKFHSTSLNR